MTIIKNLIIRNDIKNKIRNIEKLLNSMGYYEKQKQLTALYYYPEEYAILYKDINSSFGDLLDTQSRLNQQLKSLQGVNLFKNQPVEYTK